MWWQRKLQVWLGIFYAVDMKQIGMPGNEWIPHRGIVVKPVHCRTTQNRYLFGF